MTAAAHDAKIKLEHAQNTKIKTEMFSRVASCYGLYIIHRWCCLPYSSLEPLPEPSTLGSAPTLS